MSQANISKYAYRLKIALPWLINFILLTFLTSVISFLVFTGISVKTMKQTDILYKELSYQASVISLLTIITLCVVFYTFKNLL